MIRHQCVFRRQQETTQGCPGLPRKGLPSNLCTQGLQDGPIVSHLLEHSQPFSTTASRHTTKCLLSVCEVAGGWFGFPHSPLAHSSWPHSQMSHQGTRSSNTQNSICKKLERFLLFFNNTQPAPLRHQH